VTHVLADLREKLKPFYSETGRPSIDPELMLRMLIVGYCYGIRFERKLCEEVELHLAYPLVLSLSTTRYPITRHSRSIATAASVRATSFGNCSRRSSKACMDARLVKGEEFAVDASVMEDNVSRWARQQPLCR
jgi:transposase